MMALRQRQDRDGAHLAAGLVGFALGVEPSVILTTDRGAKGIARARQVSMYLAHGCHLVEERRDDPEFDAWLETLEIGIDLLAPLNWMNE